MFGGNAAATDANPFDALKLQAIAGIEAKAEVIKQNAKLTDKEIDLLFVVYKAGDFWELRVDTYDENGDTVRKGILFINLSQAVQNYEIDPMAILGSMGISEEEALAQAGAMPPAPAQDAVYVEIPKTQLPPKTEE